MSYLPADLRDRLLEADNRHCVYCHTREANTGQPMTVDHIMPQAQGGQTVFDNLCFACRRCNEFKGSATRAQDPLTGEIVALFHPRQQSWADHFQWDETGALLIGLTDTGRATIVALNMNHPVMVDVRRRWVSVGWHPPTDLAEKLRCQPSLCPRCPTPQPDRPK
ncbi:MAG: HNH endonuclease [Anaerolineales bacterium]|nr:HNH endonuclease [Anaerolineales bacterium]